MGIFSVHVKIMGVTPSIYLCNIEVYRRTSQVFWQLQTMATDPLNSRFFLLSRISKSSCQRVRDKECSETSNQSVYCKHL